MLIYSHLQEKFARLNNIAELCIVEYKKGRLDNSKNLFKKIFKLRDLLNPLSLKECNSERANNGNLLGLILCLYIDNNQETNLHKLTL